MRLGGDKPDEAEIERQGISSMCSALGVTMHEINPDGHCLYAAVADQLNLRRKVDAPTDYKLARRATHKRCAPTRTNTSPSSLTRTSTWRASSTRKRVRSTRASSGEILFSTTAARWRTRVWGGQPEILALSRAFRTQINVVQAGVPVLKVGEGEYDGEPLFISYHRKMYGLGEHYNSLRPAPTA